MKYDNNKIRALRDERKKIEEKKKGKIKGIVGKARKGRYEVKDKRKVKITYWTLKRNKETKKERAEKRKRKKE